MDKPPTPTQEWTVVSFGPDCGAITHHHAPRFRAYWDEESAIFRGIDLDRLTRPLPGSAVPVPGVMPGADGAKCLHFFGHSWIDYPLFALFQPDYLDELMQRAAVAVRGRSRPLTVQKFSILPMEPGMGLVCHHEFPRGSAWWRVADCGWEIPASPTPRAAVRIEESSNHALELIEAHWEDPIPDPAAFDRLMQQAAAMVEVWLAA